MSTSLHTEPSRDFLLSNYDPIDYSLQQPFGGGSRIRADLSTTAASLYDALLATQDMRSDRGHVDTVIYFTLKLARLMGLKSDFREAVVIAAIAHDSGWDVVPDIDRVFSALIEKKRTTIEGSPERAEVDREIFNLRKGHQDRAVEHLRRLLPSEPLLDDICLVVGDHDTRFKIASFPPYFAAFLDADRLWQTTERCMFSNGRTPAHNADPEAVFNLLNERANPNQYIWKFVANIARIEIAATMLAMQKIMGWAELPSNFLREYSEEISAIQRRS